MPSSMKPVNIRTLEQRLIQQRQAPQFRWSKRPLLKGFLGGTLIACSIGLAYVPNNTEPAAPQEQFHDVTSLRLMQPHLMELMIDGNRVATSLGKINPPHAALPWYELDQPFGNEAYNYVRQHLSYSAYSCQAKPTGQPQDKWRSVEIRCLDNRGEWFNLAHELVKKGLARAVPESETDPILELEAYARERALGIWGEDDMRTPQEFRRIQGQEFWDSWLDLSLRSGNRVIKE